MTQGISRPLLWLDEMTSEHRPRVGNKAATLGVLRQAGLPVPDGFCIPLEAAQEATNGLWLAIFEAHRRLAPDDEAVAVRSSGVAEDSPTASFAGQYETVLNVQGTQALQAAIERCWQSARSPRAEAYQSRHGAGDGSLPVLVQRQVTATMSGVLFTADPLTGQEGQMLVEAVAGLGETLVSGRASPARYRVDRLGSVQRLSDEAVLTPAQCRALAELGAQIERMLGGRQDIEWALCGEQPYILQARPMTSSTAFVPLSHLWTRANIGEVLPYVVTPLTWGVFRATLLNDPAQLSGDRGQPDSDDGLKLIHGRAYVRLDSLLDSFCYLPAVTPQVMEQVLGVNLPPVAQAYARPIGLFVRLAQGAFLAESLGWLPRLSWLVRRLPSLPLANPEKLQDVMAWTTRCFRLHLKCTAYTIGAYGLLARLLARWLPAEADNLLPIVLLGHEDLQTAAQGISLRQLAESVRGNIALTEILNSGLDWPTASRRVTRVNGGPKFLQAVQLFLEANGARVAGEFELSLPRWREDPSFLLEVLRKFLSLPPSAPPACDPVARRQRQQEANAHIRASLNPVQRWLFKRLLASYSVYTTWRENVKYQLIEGYAWLRHIFVEIGTDLATRGIIDNAADIFFLTPAEVFTLQAGDEIGHPPGAVISTRREQHSRWETDVAPDVVIGDGADISPARPGELTGIGCSPGIAEGYARVLWDPSQADSLQPGEILVSPHTDPGWTPLFLSCKAMVTEIGGFLSHGATVAREYGIPAVVNAKGATTQIHTGDLILVDGTNGRVMICSQTNPLE